MSGGDLLKQDASGILVTERCRALFAGAYDLIIPQPNILMHMSRAEMAVLLSVIQTCACCQSSADLRSVVEGLKELVPFSHFASVYARLDGGNLCDSCHVVNIDYPKEWVRLYQERKYYDVDPIVKENFSRFTIQYWADTYRKLRPEKEFVAVAEDFGLCSGYTSGIRNLSGTTGGLFSFAGIDLPRSERTRTVLELVTPHLYQAVERITSSERLERLPVLSAREKEVLKWVAYGKTSWETSVILGISDRTVKFHINNVMKKLNASTRTHAVAIASELGLVDLD